MGWIETVTKERFQLAVKEAVRPEMDKIEERLNQLSDRVSQLEGSMEGSMRAHEAKKNETERQIPQMGGVE